MRPDTRRRDAVAHSLAGKRTSHYVFKMPWSGDPRVNVQNKGGKAKPYQVKQVLTAIKKWEERS